MGNSTDLRGRKVLVSKGLKNAVLEWNHILKWLTDADSILKKK